MKNFVYLQLWLCKFSTHIGGQAVMGGLIMRNYNRYALAIRNDNNEILVEHHSWYSLSRHALLQKTFVRGFPILVETLINGVKALNRSADLVEISAKKTSSFQTIFSLAAALFLAVILFVILPHLFALSMEYFGFGGTIENLSFHVWDGLFKIFLFLGYIYAISLIPAIREVLQYHGAEHKVISCYENEMTVSAQNAKHCSRLHPRCGTSFILFVLLLAIIVHSIFIPLILFFPLSENNVTMHSVVILFKIVLIIPISACAYELIRASAKGTANHLLKILLKLLSFPGLVLQILTTKEPSIEQLEVAVIALKEVAPDTAQLFETVPYKNLDYDHKG